MKTLTINIQKKDVQKVISHIIDLGGEVIDSDLPKEELAREIKGAVEELKLIKADKKQGRDAEDFLNEL